MKTKLFTLLSGALVLASTTSAMAAAPDLAKNKAVARQWFEEVIIKENGATADKLLDKDVVVEFAPGYAASSASGMLQQKGAAQAKKHLTDTWKKYDFTGTITELIAEGDKVALLRTVTEKTADGKTAIMPWLTIFTIKDGKITGMKHLHDTLSEHS